MIKIEINEDGAAFDEAGASELARILRELADRFEHDGGPDTSWPISVRDINGNNVGWVCRFATRQADA